MTCRSGNARRDERCRRPASALRPGRRSRSRCLRPGTAPAAGACSGVERFPELAFARRALAERHVDDFVGVEAAAIGDRLDAARRCSAGFGAADRVQALRAGGARPRDDVQRLVAPVRRHLPSARARIVLRADGGQQHVERRHTELQAERAIAVVGVKPVVTGACSVMPTATRIASWPAPLI